MAHVGGSLAIRQGPMHQYRRHVSGWRELGRGDHGIGSVFTTDGCKQGRALGDSVVEQNGDLTVIVQRKICGTQPSGERGGRQGNGVGYELESPFRTIPILAVAGEGR